MDLTAANLNQPNTVIHLHGSLLDSADMVLTTQDYVRHYANDRISGDHSLVARLNAFEQIESWRGPTTRALVDALEEAVALTPSEFLPTIFEFLHAKRPFQYGLINGFKRAWESLAEKRPEDDWDRTWSLLTDFFEKLIGNPDFWIEKAAEDQDLTPTRDWIPPIIADLLRSGTRSDKKAYSPDPRM